MLNAWREGKADAQDELFERVYNELRRIARRYMFRERADHTLQPTALVNEAYLKLTASPVESWENRAQFFGIVANVMRRVLVEHARKHNAAKRGGHHEKVLLEDALGVDGSPDVDLLKLDEALNRLAKLDPRLVKVIEVRYFAGLTIPDTANVLNISEATVKNDWKKAKAWLKTELS